VRVLGAEATSGARAADAPNHVRLAAVKKAC
jgi:hypothetical protein